MIDNFDSCSMFIWDVDQFMWCYIFLKIYHCIPIRSRSRSCIIATVDWIISGAIQFTVPFKWNTYIYIYIYIYKVLVSISLEVFLHTLVVKFINGITVLPKAALLSCAQFTCDIYAKYFLLLLNNIEVQK